MSGHEERAAVAGALAFLGLFGLGFVVVTALCLIAVADDFDGWSDPDALCDWREDDCHEA